MFTQILSDLDIFFLVAARTLALVETAPLLSSDSIPQAAKIGLAGCAAAVVFIPVKAAGYPMPDNALNYLLLLVGEALIGLIIGFSLTVITSVFSMAGQFFSLQMGFSASETYDPLAQIEIPLIGQLLNLVAMLCLVATDGFQKIIMLGMRKSFDGVRAIDFVMRKDDFVEYLTGAGGTLFQAALILSFPILGTLFLVSVGMGLLSKASPQMNLLTEGFPIAITVAFVLIMVSLPSLMDAFYRIIEAGFIDIGKVLSG